MSGRGGKRAAAAREEEGSGADDNYAQQPPAKKPTRADNSSSDNSDEIVVCEIGRNRRVTVRNWRGKINVDIREFYPKDGNLLPGKKGFEVKDSVNEVEGKETSSRTESNNFCRNGCECAIIVEMEMIGSNRVAVPVSGVGACLIYHEQRNIFHAGICMPSPNSRIEFGLDVKALWVREWEKGITLSLDQWNMLRDHVEEIDKALGHS
ncbi:hypothetical protein POTOM_028585 [Populus tomentosa]|uniref:Transcriptional coactivator p15 (PC4) C-terminal domain-containing protein n=1 Tax=Populus tomentosa TaxID=118781 RepID=A0A8X7ZE44_POPTO|nr:hypothetical protein POTOM_028585 [Populus tomentosa]